MKMAVVAAQKFGIFLSTLNKSQKVDQTGTGDIDYTRSIETMINLKYPGICHYIHNQLDEAAVYAHIERHRSEFPPILHIQLNAPDIGFGFTRAGINAFKARNGKIVMTAIEFKKYGERAHKKIMLDYLELADEIIFLDEFDKKEAIKTALFFEMEELFQEKLSYAAVIPVPPTINLDLLPLEKRGSYIGFFGIIRKGKGLDHIVRLAVLIKNICDAESKKDDDPQKSKIKSLLQDKKILVIGTVLEAEKLAQLMESIYEDCKTEIKACADNLEALKKLLNNYQELQKAGKLKASLPIELHIDVPESELAPLFNQCCCFFQPHYRGASYRFSSISSLLSMGFAVFSHISDITPEELVLGANAGSLILANGDHYLSEDTRYANLVLNTYCRYLIVRASQQVIRTENPITVAQKKALALYNSKLNPAMIILEFRAIYERISGRPLANFIQNREQRVLRAWMDTRSIIQSFKHIQKISRISIFRQSEQSLRMLKDRLYEVQKQNICPDIMKLILEQRKLSNFKLFKSDSDLEDTRRYSMLTTDEASLVRFIMSCDFEARHVTDEVVLKQIQQGSKRLMSVAYRKKLGENVLNSHTSEIEGLTDQVFFSICDRNRNAMSPLFLQKYKRSVSLDLVELNERDPHLLKWGWVSDHWFAYHHNTPHEDFNINGIIFRVEYRECEKVLKFILPGSQEIFCQIVRKGDEVFTLDRMHQGMALLTIEMVRHFDLKTYQQIMAMARKIKEKPLESALERSKILQIVQARFFPGIWEFHQPCQVRIFNQPGVRIEKRHAFELPEVDLNELARQEGFEKEILEFVPLLSLQSEGIEDSAKIQNTTDAMKTLIKILICKDVDLDKIQEMIRCLDKHGLINYQTEFSNIKFSLMTAAMFGGRKDIVEFLLSLGPHVPGSWFVLEEMSSSSYPEETLYYDPLHLAICFSNPVYFREHFLSKFLRSSKLSIETKFHSTLALEYMQLLLSGPARNPESFLVATTQCVKSTHIEFACRMFNSELRDGFVPIQFLLKNYHADLNEISICWGIQTNSIDIVKTMLDKGVDLQQPNNEFHAQHHNTQVLGITALQLLCLMHRDKGCDLLTFLLQQKPLDLNKPYKHYRILRPDPYKGTNPSTRGKVYSKKIAGIDLQSVDGYSPLMLAAMGKALNLALLLLNAGADASYQAPDGENCFTLNDYFLQKAIAKVLAQDSDSLEKTYPFLKNFETNAKFRGAFVTSVIRYLINGDEPLQTLNEEFLHLLHKYNMIFEMVNIGQIKVNVFMALIIQGRVDALKYIVAKGLSSDDEGFSLTLRGLPDTQISSLALATAMGLDPEMVAMIKARTTSSFLSQKEIVKASDVLARFPGRLLVRSKKTAVKDTCLDIDSPGYIFELIRTCTRYILIKGKTPSGKDFCITKAPGFRFHHTVYLPFLNSNQEYYIDKLEKEFRGIDRRNLRWLDIGIIKLESFYDYEAFSLTICDLGTLPETAYNYYKKHQTLHPLIENVEEYDWGETYATHFVELAMQPSSDLDPKKIRTSVHKTYEEYHHGKMEESLLNLVLTGDLEKLKLFFAQHKSWNLDLLILGKFANRFIELNDDTKEMRFPLEVAIANQNLEVARLLFASLSADAQFRVQCSEKMLKLLSEESQAEELECEDEGSGRKFKKFV